MNRRDFLTRVLGATAAALVLPKIELIARALPPEVAQNLAGPAWKASFDEILKQAMREFCDGMAREGFPVPQEIATYSGGYPSGYRLGDTVRIDGQALCLTHQCGADMPSDDMERAIEPAIAALVARASFAGLDNYGQLALPTTATYAGRCGPLRMVVYFDILLNDILTRFDVLGASSPAAQRVVRRRGQEDTKRQIRRNLSRYLPPARLPA